MTDAKDFEERAEWLDGELKRRQPSSSRFHPRDEELAAYAEGGLTAARRSEVQEHLLTCPDCAGVVLDLAPPAEPAPAPELPGARAIEASWQRLRPRLAEADVLRGDRPEAKVVPLPRRASPISHPNRWAPLAAALLVAFLGSSVLNVVQWQRANQSHGLSQMALLRHTRGEAPTLRWLSPGQWFEIRLEAEGRTGPARVELLNAAGQPLDSIPAVADGETYAVTVSSSLLKPGVYGARLAAAPGQPQSEPLPFEVVRAEASPAPEKP
jgi:hypothetical protein